MQGTETECIQDDSKGIELKFIDTDTTNIANMDHIAKNHKEMDPVINLMPNYKLKTSPEFNEMYDTMLVLMLADYPFYKLKLKVDKEAGVGLLDDHANDADHEWFNLYN